MEISDQDRPLWDTNIQKSEREGAASVDAEKKGPERQTENEEHGN